MKVINWIKENWTDPVWSKVFAGLILALLLAIISTSYKLLNQLIASEWIQKALKSLNVWISKESQISNLTLLLIFIFIGIFITIYLYNMITKKWFGRTAKFYSSDNSYTIRGTYSVDLDRGIQAKDRTDADFWWQQKTKSERSIVPMNGAQFSIIGQSSKDRLTQNEIETLNFSSEEIPANNNQSNKIPNGTLIAYITKQGRLGYMKVKNYGYNLEIEFYTLRKDDE